MKIKSKRFAILRVPFFVVAVVVVRFLFDFFDQECLSLFLFSFFYISIHAATHQALHWLFAGFPPGRPHLHIRPRSGVLLLRTGSFFFDAI